MQKTYNDIPSSRPATPLLDAVNAPADLRQLNADELVQLTDELRLFMLFCVGKTGGHFGAGLGVTELTVALHYVFNTPKANNIGYFSKLGNLILAHRRTVIHFWPCIGVDT